MEDDVALKQILQRLVAEFKPTSVYLFGSRATENFRPDSDYDLLLVVSASDRGRMARIDQARQALRGVDASVDVFVYTQIEFDEWKDEFSSIPETALNTGKALRVG